MYYTLSYISPFTGEEQTHILYRLDDGGILSFPVNADNPNYQQYLAWLEEGNTPEPWEVTDGD